MEQSHNTDQLVGYFDGTLSEEQRRDVESHLATCTECRCFMRFMNRFTRELIDDYESSKVPPGRCLNAMELLDLVDGEQVALVRLWPHVLRCPICRESFHELQAQAEDESHIHGEARPSNREHSSAPENPLIDSVLGDVQLPSMSGSEVVNLLDSLAGSDSPRVLLVSGIVCGEETIDVGYESFANGRIALGVRASGHALPKDVRVSLRTKQGVTVNESYMGSASFVGLQFQAKPDAEPYTLHVQVGEDQLEVPLAPITDS
jgi:hypothetical protein